MEEGCGVEVFLCVGVYCLASLFFVGLAEQRVLRPLEKPR